MGARVGGSARADAGGVTSIQINYTPSAAGNLLTLSGAGVPYPTESTTRTVADSSSTNWTQKINGQQQSGRTTYAIVAFRENIPSGLTSVTLSMPEQFYGHFTVDEWSGIKTSGAFDTQVDADSASPTDTTLASGNLTLGAPNGLVIGACYGDDSGNASWDTTLGSWVEIMQYGDTSASSAAQSAYRIASGSTGPYSLTWSYSVNIYGMCSMLVSFLDADSTPPHARPYSPDAAGMRTVLRM